MDAGACKHLTNRTHTDPQTQVCEIDVLQEFLTKISFASTIQIDHVHIGRNTLARSSAS